MCIFRLWKDTPVSAWENIQDGWLSGASWFLSNITTCVLFVLATCSALGCITPWCGLGSMSYNWHTVELIPSYVKLLDWHNDPPKMQIWRKCEGAPSTCDPVLSLAWPDCVHLFRLKPLIRLSTGDLMFRSKFSSLEFSKPCFPVCSCFGWSRFNTVCLCSDPCYTHRCCCFSSLKL